MSDLNNKLIKNQVLLLKDIVAGMIKYPDASVNNPAVKAIEEQIANSVYYLSDEERLDLFFGMAYITFSNAFHHTERPLRSTARIVENALHDMHLFFTCQSENSDAVWGMIYRLILDDIIGSPYQKSVLFYLAYSALQSAHRFLGV